MRHGSGLLMDAKSSPISAKQQSILRAFDGKIYVSNSLDVQTGALWDSVLIPAHEWDVPLRRELFSEVNRPYSETNMVQCRRLDAPEAFSISRVVFTFQRDIDERELYEFAENTVWSFWLGHIRYLQNSIGSLQTVGESIAPIKICDFCTSVFVGEQSCPGCGARQFQFSQPMVAGRRFYLDLTVNIVIAQQMSFWVQLETFSRVQVSKPFRVWCHLEGLHAWGVQ